MCPSYMATRNERNTTRARANMLREFLTNSTKNNPFNHKELFEILDLCLSCKGCKNECPSSVDMAKLKAEFLYQWYKNHRFSIGTFRNRMVANITRINALGSLFPAFTNYLLANARVNNCQDNGFYQRSLPTLSKITLKQWYRKRSIGNNHSRKVYLLADEFSRYNDSHWYQGH